MARQFVVGAVLFDLDGTLLDTIGDLTEACNRMLAELGRPTRPLEEIHSFVGKGMAVLVERCLTVGNRATAEEIHAALPVFRRHYEVVNGDTATLYPGVLESLQHMRALGLPLACVTNKPEGFTRPLLARTGLADYFPVVVGGDTLPQRKPDPAMLHHACGQFGVPAARALMIGDSANDAQAARAAGMPVILTTYGYAEGMPVDTIDCDGLVSSVTEVLPHLVPAGR